MPTPSAEQERMHDAMLFGEMAEQAKAIAQAFASSFEMTARIAMQMLQSLRTAYRDEILFGAVERAGVPASDVRRFNRTLKGWTVTTWNRRTIDLTPYMERR